MEGGRDGKQKGIRRNGRKEGMGVDGKEERKRQGKTEKKAFLWRLLPPGLRRSVVDELSYQHYFLSPYTQEGKGWTNRDGQTRTDERGKNEKRKRTKERKRQKGR